VGHVPTYDRTWRQGMESPETAMRLMTPVA
jgi:hypothetical protein